MVATVRNTGETGDIHTHTSLRTNNNFFCEESLTWIMQMSEEGQSVSSQHDEQKLPQHKP